MVTIEQLAAMVIHGVIIAALGAMIYEAGSGYFKNITSEEFVDKHTAQGTLIIAFVFTSIVGEPLFARISGIVAGWHIFQHLGSIAVVSRFVTNFLVDDWNHDDSDSVIWYAAGAISFILGG
jgi:hypothetical protein